MPSKKKTQFWLWILARPILVAAWSYFRNKIQIGQPKICSIRSFRVQLLFSIFICIERALTTSVHVCVFYAVRKRRKFSGHVSSCGPAVCCVLVGVRWSQSRFNWCQAVLCEKAIRDAPRDRKPFIRGLPPGAGLAASPRLSHCLPPTPCCNPPS